MADIFELLKRKAKEQYAQGQPYRDLFFKGDPSGVLAKLEAWKNLPMEERVAQATDIGMGFAGTMKGVGKIDKLTGLPLNKDGTVTLYHHTNKDAAEKIFKTGRLQSAGEPDVYLTTQKINDTGYGDVVVPINIKPSLLNIDDEFPSGRLDFRVNVGKPKGSINVDAKAPLTKYENAQDIAQQNAALPIEKGGLGLPKNNTAMDRAKAMGFDVNKKLYHGTSSDISSFIPSKGGEYGGGVYLAEDPAMANYFSSISSGESKNIIPVVTSANKILYTSDKNIPRGLGVKGLQKKGYESVIGTGVTGETQRTVLDPSMIRSVNAAFDPFRRNEADILAGLLAVPATQLLEDDKDKKKRKTK